MSHRGAGVSKKKWAACGACPNCTPLAVVCASTSSPHRTPPWNGTSPSQSSAGLKHPAPITPARCAAAECRAALALSRTAVALRCSPRRDAPRRTPPATAQERKLPLPLGHLDTWCFALLCHAPLAGRAVTRQRATARPPPPCDRQQLRAAACRTTASQQKKQWALRSNHTNEPGLRSPIQCRTPGRLVGRPNCAPLCRRSSPSGHPPRGPARMSTN